MHDDQVVLTDAMARALIRGVCTDADEQSIVPLATSATTSYIYRVGDNLAARFPMQGDDAIRARLESEREAAAEFAGVGGFASPEVVAIGEPGSGYPLPWTLQTWVDGDPVTPASMAASDAFAGDLAALIRNLRAADTGGRAFAGRGRGGDFARHDEWIRHCLKQSEGMLPVERLREAWAALRETPRAGADVMSHRDLVPANVLARDGRLGGVLDAGDFGPADPALDLVAAWHMLDAERRALLRDLVACDDAEWRRGAAWALQQALGLVWYYVDSNPSMSELGRSTIDRILDAPEIDV